MAGRSVVVALAGSLPLPTLAAQDETMLTGTWFGGLDAAACDETVPVEIVPRAGPHENELVDR